MTKKQLEQERERLLREHSLSMQKANDHQQRARQLEERALHAEAERDRLRIDFHEKRSRESRREELILLGMFGAWCVFTLAALANIVAYWWLR